MQRRRLMLETLETRLLLASDFVFDADLDGMPAFDLTLSSDGINLQLRDAQGHIVKSQALDDNSGSAIIRGSTQDDALTIDGSVPELRIVYDAGLGTDLLTMDGGNFSSVVYAAQTPDAGTIIRDGQTIEYAGLEPILDTSITPNRVIGLSAADDPDAVLSASPVAGFDLRVAGSTFERIDFLNPASSLTITGLAGTDAITVASLDSAFNADLTIQAERIVVAAAAVIAVDGDVTLNAVATSTISGAVAPTAIDLRAEVRVDGSITAAGHVQLSAFVDNVLSLNATATALAVQSQSSAIAQVSSSATINAATLELTASTTAELSATVNTADSGTIDLGSSSVPLTQTTHALIEGGAQVTVGSGPISSSQPASLLVQAIDTSDIQSQITTGTIAAAEGFDGVRSAIHLRRDTQAAIGDASTSTVLAGPNAAAAGLVRIEAANRSGPGGGIQGVIHSNFSGVHTTRVDRDDAAAEIKNTSLQVTALEVSADNSTHYLSDAKKAENRVVGSTTASLDGTSVTAAPTTTDQGVLLTARDRSSYTARSSGFSAEASDFVAVFPAELELDKFSAVNQVQKDTSASILGSSHIINVTDGDVRVMATSELQVSATVDAATITDVGNMLPAYNLRQNGAIATNQVRGDVVAYLDGGTVTVSGSQADVLVDARNLSDVDARTEATSRSSRGSNSVVGTAVALNAIGWEINNALTSTLDALIGTELGATQDDGGTEAIARITAAKVTAGGDVTVTADSAPQVNATVSNVSKLTRSALYGASGVSVGGVVSSNLVTSNARAFVRDLPTGETMTVGDQLLVHAADNAGIYANSKLITSQVTTNTGGVAVLNDAVANELPATYATDDLTLPTATKALQFGDTVRLGSRFDDNRGTPGRVYVYLGEGGTAADNRNLLDEDYTNLDVWKEQVETRILNGGLNLSDSNSVALGGLVVRNVVAGGVEAYLDAADVVAAAVTVEALEQATLRAVADAAAKSSGGSAFGEGTSLGANGVVAVNVVLSQAQAYIVDSEITTQSGALVVDARNTSRLGARTSSAIESGADAIGIVLAFNTIGYQAQDLLRNTIDAVLGLSPNAFGNESPARVDAFIKNSSIHAAGDVTVTAISQAELEAYVGSNATAAAAAMVGASAMSVTGVLASNKVSTAANASIEYTGSVGLLEAAGNVAVTSSDDTRLNSATNMIASATRSNDLGTGIVNDLVKTLTSDYKYTTNSGVRSLAFGDQVRLDDADHTTDVPVQTILQGDWIKLASDVGGGQKDQVFEYLGSQPIVGTTTAGNIDFSTLDFTDNGLWREIHGTPGTVYEYMGHGGTTADTRDLAIDNFTDFERWKELAQHNVISSSVTRALLDNLGLKNGDGDSRYAMISRNDLNSSVTGHIDHARLRHPTLGNSGPSSVVVSANEAARLKATDNSVVSSSSSAGGGVITNNQLRGTADAYLLGSDIVTATGGSGDVAVTAKNVPTMEAVSLTSSNSGEQVGVVFAFNTIGWDNSNLFSQLFDAVLGDDILTNEQPARAHAYLRDTVMDVAGDVSVKAESSAMLRAVTGNEQVAEPTNTFVTTEKFGFYGLSGAGILASNRVSGEAKAWIDYSPGYVGPKTITAGGILEVLADDASGITADSKLVASVVSINNLDPFNDVAVALGLDDYEYTTASGSQNILPFTRVRLGGSFQGPAGQNFGDTGSVYEYIGGITTIDLGVEDFTNTGRWRKVTLGLEDERLNIGNLSTSGARSFGGLVMLNDVRSNVLATVDQAVIRATEVVVSATQEASLLANAENTIVASGGSAWGTGTVLAVNGQIVTNLVQAQADARVSDSDITTTGADVRISAQNTSGVDATILSHTDTGDTGAGITLAFNTLGWRSQNLLFNTIDALIGDPLIANAFGDEVAARAHAVVQNTPVHSAGKIDITADNAAQLNATVSNAARSAASALYNAGGQVVGGILASNKVSTSAEAYIDNSGLPFIVASPDIVSGKATTVSAEDKSGLYSNIKVVASSITTNDGGVKVLKEELADALPVRYASSEGTRTLQFGDRVRLADDHTGGGNAGSIYEYMGAGGNPEDERDLSTEDYSNTDYWKEALETRLFPQGYNITDSDSSSIGGLVVYNELDSHATAFIDGAVLRAAGDLTVSASETATMKATADSFMESSGGSVFGKGKSLAANGVVATNVVLANADAYVQNSDIATTLGGNVLVTALDNSQVTADTLAVTNSGADTYSVLLAFNSLGWESNNLLFNTLDALLGLSETEFDYQETATAQDGLKFGDRVKLDVGGIYSYIGDTLAGPVDLSQQDYGNADLWRPIYAAFGREAPARALAYVIDTPVVAAGDMTVKAESNAKLAASVSNDATAQAAAFFGASAMSANGVLASNKVSSLAKAYVDFTGTMGRVQAGGKVDVTARDGATMDATTALGNTGRKNNDFGAGLLNDLYNKMAGEYRYTTKSGTQALHFGDMVRIASDYALPTDPVDANQETAGKLFQYMGAGGQPSDTRDLAVEDFSNYEQWKEVTQDSLIPSQVSDAALRAFKMDLGKGKSFYGMVVRNDVQGKVVSFVENADVDAGGSMTISAVEAARLTAVEQSVVQANSEAAGFVISTNQLQAQALAYLRDSNVTTLGSGDVVVGAQNVAELDASSLTKSKADDSVGVVVAFNTIGWNASNILFQAFDALVGDSILTGLAEDDQDGAKAFIQDSTINSAHDVRVTADASAKLNATTGNEQTSRAVNALVLDSKQGKKGVSGGGTLASNKVRSIAQAYIDNASRHSIEAGAAVVVRAKDEASIDANTKAETSTITTNDLSAIADVLGKLLPDKYSYTTASGVQDIANAYPSVSGALKPEFGVRVRVGPNYDSSKGDAGAVYQYLGIAGSVDLGQEDYRNAFRWRKITGGIDDVKDAFPNFGNLSASDARAIGIVIVLNDVRSDVDARIHNTDVVAGQVSVQAIENASIRAYVENNVTALGGSAYKKLGEGTVYTGGGSLVTNLVQSQADAVIEDSRITANATGNAGHVVVDARNTSGLDATLLTTGASGDTAGSLVLAFNTLGWKSQNVLFDTIDALIGDPLIADAFGGADAPARAQSYIRNTPVDATGDVTVTADNAARLNATVSNAATSTASAMYDATGKAIGGVVSLNKVNSAALAFIDNQGAAPIPGTSRNLRAGGTLTIKAADDSQNYANVKLVSSSITTNDGGIGVLTESGRDFLYADFSTNETSANVRYGQRVRLADSYAGGGRGGGVYEWLGTDADGSGLDLSAQDYSDKGYWKEVLESQLFPEGINMDNSDSLAIGGLVVLNDLRSVVESKLVNANVQVAQLDMDAIENAVIKATADSSVSSSGGSSFSGDGQSLAVNATIATNVVLSSADAFVANSTLETTTGDVAIDAVNTSKVDAKTLSATTTGAQGVGVTLAFNTLGWKSQNLLFNTVDALLGDPLISGALGNQQPAAVHAYIVDSDVNAAGGIRLSAVSEAQLNAIVTNETVSAAYSFGLEGDGASGFAVGFVLSHNMVNSEAKAYIDSTSVGGPSRRIDAQGGGIEIIARDDAAIDANSKLAAVSSSTNDFGLTMLTQFADRVLGEYQYTDRSGVRNLKSLNQVRLDDVDFTTQGDDPSEIVGGNRVEISFDLSNGSAAAGDVYEYIGSAPLSSPDLDQLNYQNAALWKPVAGTPGGTYRFLGADEDQVDLAQEDYTDGNRWLALMTVDPRALVPGLSFNVKDSDSAAFGGIFVHNDLRSDVAATINRARVNAAGTVHLEAIESAQVFARDTSTVTSSGGGTFGGGNSFALNGVFSTNLVLSKSNATITDSSVTTTAGGNVTLDAQNASKIDASVKSLVESNGASIGAMLAFNTIGITSQNLLFNSIDALLGTNIAAEQPAEVKAYARNTTIDAAGGIQTTATLSADINAVNENSATSIAASTEGGNAITLGGVLTLNKLITQVEASLDDAGVLKARGGDLTITATDSSKIDAQVEAASVSVAAGFDSAKSIAVGLSMARNQNRNDTLAMLRDSGSESAPVDVTGGNVLVSATESAAIHASSKAVAVAVAVSLEKSTLAISGGGAVAVNEILGGADAIVDSSPLVVHAAGGAAGTVAVRVQNSADIAADVLAAAVSVGIAGSGAVPAIAIGASLAENRIGFSSAFDRAPIDVVAYIKDSSVAAPGGLSVTAESTAAIDARIASAAVAVAGSTGNTLALTAAGMLTINKISAVVKAYVDGASSIETGSGGVTVTASDRSSVTAEGAAVSASVAFSTQNAVSLALGLSLAFNTIDNQVAAYLKSVDRVTTSGGDVVVAASDAGKIDAVTVAAAVAVGAGVGGLGVAIGGGGAVAENVILTTSNAFIEDSNLGTTLSPVGKVDLDAHSDAAVSALVGAVAATVGVGSTTGVGVSIGIAVARNFVGYDLDNDAAYNLTESDKPTTLATGTRVRVNNGPLGGDVYEYVGSTLSGTQPIDLSTQNYGDRSAWKLVSVSESPAGVQAYILDSSIHADGALTQDALAKQSIDAIVVAGSVAVGGGGATGVGVSGAGVYAENDIRSLVKAFVDGDGDEGIRVADARLTADDASSIRTIAGAASIAAAIGGTTGVAVSIGLGIALNEVANEVEAYIKDADQNFTTTTGDVSLVATSQGRPVFTLTGGDLAASGVTFADLDDAGKADQDDPDSPLDEAQQDRTGDALILTNIRNAFAAKGLMLATEGVVSSDSSLRISTLDQEQGWSLVAPDGATFILKKDGTSLRVSRSTIDAIAASASIAAGFGTVAGVAVSGGGAVAQNVDLTKTNAFISGSRITSADDVTLSAANNSDITSTVATVSLAVGVGGAAGVGVSIGIGVAQNYVGWQRNGSEAPAEVQAYIVDASVDAQGDITQTAIASQTVSSVVFAGSVALAGGGKAGVAVSGSGVFSENTISVDTRAYIDGDRPIGNGVVDGIRADSISLTAQDTSVISAFAGAASLAASLSGVAGVSLSVGLSLAKNTIGGDVLAYVANADDGLRTTSGNLSLQAREAASIDAVSAAASLAAGFGLAAGVSLSGAGAESTNVIQTDAKAYAASSQLFVTGQVDLNASNTAAIDAFVLTASFSASAGGLAGVGASIGAALAQNLIGWNPGGAPTAEVLAYLQDSSLSATGNANLKASSQGSIESIVVAGSGAVSGGGVGVALSGSGVSAVNKIGTHTRASIDGDRNLGITTGHLTLTATDQSTIKADAGAVSLAAALGGAIGGSLAIGVALARNELANVVEAYIKNVDQGATVSSLTMSAEESGSITSRTAAASLAVGAAGFAGVGLAGAGAEAVNIIGTDTRAYVRDSRLMSAGKVDLDAENTSTIDAKVAAVSAAIGVGGAAGFGVAIGAAVAHNEIGTLQGTVRDGAEVQAYLRDTSVQAAGDLTLDALSQQTITSTVVAGSAAVAAAFGVAIAAAGAGVSSENTIRTDVRAFIDGDGDTGIAAREIHLDAKDMSTIESEAGSMALAASLAPAGVSISVAVGVTLARNTIENIVEATTQHAENLTAGVGGISLSADEEGTITSTATAATAAGSFAQALSVSISVGTTTADNLLDSKVSAIIKDSGSVVANGTVDVAAEDTSTINSTISSQSLAAGLVGIAIGLSKASNTLKDQVAATIQNSDVTVQSGAVSIRAKSAPTNSTESTVSALAAGLFTGAGVGASAVATIEDVTLASIDGGIVTVASGDLTVRAVSSSSATPEIDGGALGLAAISSLSVDATIRGTTEALVTAGTTLRAPQGKVTVTAVSNSYGDARTKSSGVGILLDVSTSKPTTKVVGSTSASMLGEIVGLNGQPGAGSVLVLADAIDFAAAGAEATGGGLISVKASNVTANASPSVIASAGGVIMATGAVTISAVSATDADSSSRSSSGGLVAVTDLNAASSADASVKADISPDARIQAGTTLTVSALHGKTPEPYSDGRFDAAAAVDPADNSITLALRHGLLTGDVVTYQADGGTVVGGLTNGRQYSVIATDDKTLQFGVTFGSNEPSSSVDGERDLIRFSYPHNLIDDDLVTYQADPDAATVGGLSSGSTYRVKYIDDTTIKLIDPAQVPAAAQEFSGSNVSGNTITISGHGFANGQPVTYRAPQAFDFHAGAVADAQDTIQVGAGHSFQAGDEVIYTVAAPDTDEVIGGLISGQRYFVIFDPAQPALIKLARTSAEALGNPTAMPPVPPTPIDLTPSTDVKHQFDKHTLRKVVDQPIGGLADGVTYYVTNAVANTFQLAKKPDGSMLVTLDPIDSASGVTLTGKSKVGTEGIDFTSAGSRRHELVLDITADGSGTQRLDGVGGSQALAAAPTGDGIVSSSASGSSGGLVRVSGANTSGAATPNVQTTIGDRASLQALDIVIDATTIGNAFSSSSNSGGGLVSVGIAKATTTLDLRGTLTVGNAATMAAERDLRLSSEVKPIATVLADSNGGGLVDIAKANVKATVNYASRLQIGTNARLTAEELLRVASQARVVVNATVTTDASGLGAGAGSGADVLIGGGNDGVTTQLGANAELKGRTVEMLAQVASIGVRADASGEANAAGADAAADAPIDFTDKATVRLDGGSRVTGDQVTINASHDAVDIVSIAEADCDCGVGAAGALARINYETQSLVVSAVGATVAARDLTVQAIQDIQKYDRSASADVAFLGSESEREEGVLNAAREIDWHGNVLLLSGPSPRLLVDANGRVVEADNVTVNGGLGKDAVIGGPVIAVDPIINDDNAGTILFTTNMVPVLDDVDPKPPKGLIKGSGGTVSTAAAYKSITLQQLGDRQLVLHDMRVANPDATPHVELDSEEVTLLFNVSSQVEPTDIVILNDGNGDVLLAGEIDNPIGSTTLTNTGGSIIGQPGGLIRSNLLSVSAAGDIGTATDRARFELVRSNVPTTGLTVHADQDVFLDLRPLERGASSPEVLLQSPAVTAGGVVDLLLQSGLRQNASIGKGGALTVTVTQEGQTQDYYETFRPDRDPPTRPDLDPRVFTDLTQSVETPALYDFAAVVGHDIRFQAANPGPADERVSFQANTDVASSGQIDALTNGHLTIRETQGDLRLGDIISTAGDVTLFACNGPTHTPPEGGHESCGPEMQTPGATILSLASATDTTAHVVGNSVTLIDNAGLGLLGDSFEINSSNQAPGVVRVITRNSIFLTETEGDLALDGVASNHGNVYLRTVTGSILDGIVEVTGDLADIQGTDIDLEVSGGGIGAVDNPVEIYGGGSFQQHNTLEIDTGIPQEGRLYANAPGSIYLKESNARLNVLKVESTAGDVQLFVHDTIGAREGTSTPLPEDFMLLASGGTTQSGLPIAFGTVRAVQGAVLIDAGDDVYLPAGTLVIADTLAVVRGDYGALTPQGERDAGLGTTIDVQGDVRADLVQFQGGGDLDFIRSSARRESTPTVPRCCKATVRTTASSCKRRSTPC